MAETIAGIESFELTPTIWAWGTNTSGRRWSVRLKSVNVSFVFRRVANSIPRLIGEAYVHGAMHRETVDGQDSFDTIITE